MSICRCVTAAHFGCSHEVKCSTVDVFPLLAPVCISESYDGTTAGRKQIHHGGSHRCGLLPHGRDSPFVRFVGWRTANATGPSRSRTAAYTGRSHASTFV